MLPRAVSGDRGPDPGMAIGRRVNGWLRALAALVRSEQLWLTILAALVGAVAAYAAIAFRELADLTAMLVYGGGEAEISFRARLLPWWLLPLLPAAGGLVLGLLCWRVLPGPLPQGVADVVEASALRGGRMPLAPGLAAAFLSATSIGVGASVGREGPIVHLGATLAARVAERLHLGPALARTLLGCGVAASVAAAFNAPIAGVFFALEVVVGHYGLGAFSPVVIASLVGTIVTRVHIGEYPAFALGSPEIASYWEVPAFLLLGAVCAAAAIALVLAIGLVQDLHERFSVPPPLRPALAGLFTGAIAIWFPQVLGVGYEITTAALLGTLRLGDYVLLAVAKAAATAVCLGSLFGGGIFSPSLAIGALTGGAFGLVAAGLFPDLGSDPQIYATLGMGAFAAVTLGAPISTAIMIFELTSNYAVTFALMASIAVASLVTRQLFGHSFFTWQLARRGIELSEHRELGLLRHRRVVEVMRDDQVSVLPDDGLATIWARFHERHGPVFVVDGAGRLVGRIDFEDLLDAGLDPDHPADLVAAKLMRPVAVTLHPGDDLASALARCRAFQLEHLPVVDERDSVLVGEVRMRDLIEAYNLALLEARAFEQGQR